MLWTMHVAGVEARGQYVTVVVVCLLTAAPVFRQISDRPHNMNVTEGDTVVINCTAYADPKAHVQWFQNGTQLEGKSISQAVG